VIHVPVRQEDMVHGQQVALRAADIEGQV